MFSQILQYRKPTIFPVLRIYFYVFVNIPPKKFKMRWEISIFLLECVEIADKIFILLSTK